jgi:hypothetical protein
MGDDKRACTALYLFLTVYTLKRVGKISRPLAPMGATDYASSTTLCSEIIERPDAIHVSSTS